ncbi:MAG TPA: DUF3592 domain-containing protein [Steroidobacteraceae bacterium]
MDLMSVAAFIGGAVWSLLTTQRIDEKGLELQREIVKRGAPAQGRIVKIWHPPLIGCFPRVYFEFQPCDSDETIRACHVHRGAHDGLVASLPAVGTQVSVRYLPEDPARAVIAKLVSRWARE